MNVILEIGRARTFASAVDWPGWSRAGRDAASALQALSDYGPRYARAVAAARLGFHAPAGPASLTVTDRRPGTATTDFGAPDAEWPEDAQPVSDAELRRFTRLLEAVWGALDAAADAARGRELRKGPRGGGRDLDAILEHVQGVDAAYLRQLGGQLPRGAPADLALTRQVMLETLARSAHGEVPAQGPRGGRRWTARYFVRRLAWHALDHAWEIEDRAGLGDGR
jgi:hypothetical protein